MDFVSKMMNSVLKLMNFAFKGESTDPIGQSDVGGECYAHSGEDLDRAELRATALPAGAILHFKRWILHPKR